jgi:hypothetical protein
MPRIIPIPVNSTRPKRHTCWPTWPPSPTREPSAGAATGWSPSWAWQPPRFLAGARSIAAIAEWAADSPQPVRAALSARQQAPAASPSRPRRPSVARPRAWMPTPWSARSAPGWPTGSLRVQRPAVAGRCGGRQDAARRPRNRRPGPYRGRGYRGCAADPPRGCRVPGRHQAGGLPVGGQGQPAHPAGPLRPPAWHRVPVADRTRDRGHGRVELRSLKAVSVRHFGFPHAAQVIQVTRKRRDLHTNRWQTVVVYAITSLPFEQARPARLADLLRGGTGPSKRCTTSAMSPSPRTPPRSAPAPPHRHGGLAEPGRRRAQPGRAAQRRRRATPPPRDPHRPLATLGISLG